MNLGERELDPDPDPIAAFARWFGEAETSGMALPNAMALATAGPDGVPSVRMVLLKSFDERGFDFFTNYESAKAHELAANARAAVVFWWQPLERQVRIAGTVTKLDRPDSESYWATRPRGSQLGAWVSDQSRVIGSRAVLEERFADLQRDYEGAPIPAPPHWGGYRLAPVEIEFWSGRADRLHDRWLYRRAGDAWTIERLAP